MRHIPDCQTDNLASNCEFCGFVINSQNELREHLQVCNAGFQNVRNKICKYYVHGGCLKGELCTFSHPPEKQFRAAPNCRRGRRCSYLANGACRFFHYGVGVQQQHRGGVQERQMRSDQSNQSDIPQCKFGNDCFRAPYCPFYHYEEDFPKLKKTNNPPMEKMNNGWEEY